MQDRDGTLIIAISDPMDMQAMDDLSFVLNRDVEFVTSTPSSIAKALDQFYAP